MSSKLAVAESSILHEVGAVALPPISASGYESVGCRLSLYLFDADTLPLSPNLVPLQPSIFDMLPTRPPSSTVTIPESRSASKN